MKRKAFLTGLLVTSSVFAMVFFSFSRNKPSETRVKQAEMQVPVPPSNPDGFRIISQEDDSEIPKDLQGVWRVVKTADPGKGCKDEKALFIGDEITYTPRGFRLHRNSMPDSNTYNYEAGVKNVEYSIEQSPSTIMRLKHLGRLPSSADEKSLVSVFTLHTYDVDDEAVVTVIHLKPMLAVYIGCGNTILQKINSQYGTPWVTKVNHILYVNALIKTPIYTEGK